MNRNAAVAGLFFLVVPSAGCVDAFAEPCMGASVVLDREAWVVVEWKFDEVAPNEFKPSTVHMELSRADNVIALAEGSSGCYLNVPKAGDYELELREHNPKDSQCAWYDRELFPHARTQAVTLRLELGYLCT